MRYWFLIYAITGLALGLDVLTGGPRALGPAQDTAGRSFDEDRAR
ncbi:hypothetical protein N9L47_06215 [Rhodobacteraceae bacterium]|nr:hypothetical protein [Paracoccaceae bacterium]